MADRFQPGDVVQLKSGGPIMTVDGKLDDEIWAVWFAYGKRHRQLFGAPCLQRATPPQAYPIGAQMVGARPAGKTPSARARR